MLLILKKNIHVFNFKKEYPFSTVPLSLSELSTGSEKDTLQGRLKFRESHIVAVTSKILWDQLTVKYQPIMIGSANSLRYLCM